MREYLNQFLVGEQRPLLMRDPVHNYIELTPIEKDLIDTPVFQRLRFVTQNSTLFYTYPSNRSSRFEHSIGAAHLAGRFISAALRSRHDRVVERFLSRFDETLGRLCQENNIEAKSYIGKDRIYSVEALVWQVARLVVLLHDIGHLPFSHLTEHAVAPHFDLILGGHESEGLWQERRERSAYHEFVSLQLITTSPDIARVFGDIDGQPRQLFLQAVRATFEQSEPVLKTLYNLMSGEIDADRGDYIARDGRNSGVEFGNYDVSRLADFMRLHEHQDAFSVVPMELALSSVETFFASRYQLYKWVIFHHHVAATDTALQHAIDVALERKSQKDPIVGDLLDCRRFRADGMLLDGTFSDDIWLWSDLREIYRRLRKRGDEDTTEDDRFFLKLLDCCLHRGKLVSLWKTVVDYRNFSSQAFSPAFRAAINKKYEKLRDEGVIENRQPEQKLWDYYEGHIALNLVAEHCVKYDYLQTRSLERVINANAKDFRILLEPKRFSPARTTDGAKLLTKRGDAELVTEYSAAVGALPGAWERDVHLYAFAVPIDTQPVDRKSALNRFIEGFVRWYELQPDLKFPGPTNKRR